MIEKNPEMRAIVGDHDTKLLLRTCSWVRNLPATLRTLAILSWPCKINVVRPSLFSTGQRPEPTRAHLLCGTCRPGEPPW